MLLNFKTLVYVISLFVVFSSYADVSIINRELNYFKKENFSLKDIDYYISLNKNNLPDSIWTPCSFCSSLKETERVLSFRARFVLNKRMALSVEHFEKAETFNKLNRKTRFKKITKNLFSAERSSFPFTIKFNLEVFSSNLNTGENYTFFRSNTGINEKTSFIVTQKMKNYNRFIEETHFYFGVYNLQNNRSLIEVFGWIALNPSVPDLIQNKMKNDYSEKILHFRKSLKTHF